MKLLGLCFTLFMSFQVKAADTCVNLTGLYQSDKVTAMRFTQNACISLKIDFGEIQQNGKIYWHKIPLRSLLNGSPTCNTFGCVTGSANNSSIELSRDKAWFTYDSQHGGCDYNHDTYSRNTQGNLVRKQNVYNCQDGYTGPIEITLIPIK